MLRTPMKIYDKIQKKKKLIQYFNIDTKNSWSIYIFMQGLFHALLYLWASISSQSLLDGW